MKSSDATEELPIPKESLELAIEKILKTYAEAEVTFIPADWHEIEEHQEAIKALTSLIQREVLKGRIAELEKVHAHWRKTYQSEKVQSRVEQRLLALKEEVSK